MNIKIIINAKSANLDTSKQRMICVYIADQNNMEVQTVMNVDMTRMKMEKKLKLYVKIAFHIQITEIFIIIMALRNISHTLYLLKENAIDMNCQKIA